MGYFPNGATADDYQQTYCARCVHGHPEHGCPVMLIHWLENYDECNNKASILHKMIPRDEEGFNGQCFAFVEKP